MEVSNARKLMTLLSTCTNDQAPLQQIVFEKFKETDLFSYVNRYAPEIFSSWKNKNIREIYREIDELKQIKSLHEKSKLLLLEALKSRDNNEIKKLEKPIFFELSSMLAFVTKLEIIINSSTPAVNYTNIHGEILFDFFDMPITYSLADCTIDEQFSVSSSIDQTIIHLLKNQDNPYIIEQSHYFYTTDWIESFQKFYPLIHSKFLAFTPEGKASLAAIHAICELLEKEDFHSGFNKAKAYRNEIMTFIDLFDELSTIHIIHEEDYGEKKKVQLVEINDQLNRAIHKRNFTEIIQLVERVDINNLNELYQLNRTLSAAQRSETYITNIKEVNLENILKLKDRVQTSIPKKDKKLKAINQSEIALNDFFGQKKYSIPEHEFRNRSYLLRRQREAKHRCEICGKKLFFAVRKKTTTCWRHRSFSKTATLFFTKKNAKATFIIALILTVSLFLNLEKKAAIAGLAATNGLNIPSWQYYVGSEYFTGEYVEQDIKKGVEWIEMAAENENPRAQTRLGSMYAYGVTVNSEDIIEEDYEKAKSLFEKAIAKEEPTAFAMLGYLYFAGMGVEKDEDTALELINKSLTYNFDNKPLVLGMLGAFYEEAEGEKKDYNKAFEYYLLASEAGYKNSMLYLAELYEKGIGVEQDSEQARKWMKKYQKTDPFKVK